MKLVALGVLAFLIQAGLLQSETLLDRPVPWAGTIRKQTLGEVVARMKGWADVDAKRSLRFATPLTKEETGKMIDNLEIADDPRPTYGAVLLAAFKVAGCPMEIEESENGIIVARIFTRSIRIDYATVTRWKKAGVYSNEELSARLRKNGYQTSKYFGLNLSSGGLLVWGLREDLDTVASFLGKLGE